MGIQNVYGLPGVRAARESTYRRILRQGEYTFLAGGGVIAGVDSRDPGNTGALDVLRPGTLMGLNTTTGEWAPSIIGVVASAYTSGGTSLTISAAQATELVRRLGSTGTATATVIGAPTATGTVALTDLTWSAVNTTTGVITITDLGVDKVAGSLLVEKDGTGYPRSFIPDGWPLKVTDQDGNNIDVPWPTIPVAGVVDTSQLLFWPPSADTTLIQWIKDQLNGTNGGVGSGKFVFDDSYQV